MSQDPQGSDGPQEPAPRPVFTPPPHPAAAPARPAPPLPPGYPPRLPSAPAPGPNEAPGPMSYGPNQARPLPLPGAAGTPGRTQRLPVVPGSHPDDAPVRMSSGGGWPEFVAPPEAGTGHPAERLPGTPSAGSGRASVLLLCAAVAAAVLLTLAGFLPWLNLAWSGLDPGLPAGPSRYSGLRADGTGSMVVFAGCVALGLTVACLALRRPRLLASAAAPGGVALVACVIFALRQQELGDRLAGSGPQGGLVTLRLSLGYGWFVAVLASLAVLALGLGGLAGPRKQPHRTAAGGQS